MNVSHQNTDNLNAVISIEISKADYQDKVDKSLRAYGQKANIPGFRKGKVPFSILTKMFGKSVRVEEINRLVSEALYNYIRDNKLNILGEPMTAEDMTVDLDAQDDFTFRFDVALAPELNVKVDKSIKVPYYTITVDDDMVKRQDESFRARFGKQVSVDESTDENLTLRLKSVETENHLRLENRSLLGPFDVTAGLNADYAVYTNRTFQRAFAEVPREIRYSTDLGLFRWGLFATAGYKSAGERFTASLGFRLDACDYSSPMSNPLKQFSPRLALSYNVAGNIYLNGSIGRYYQLPAYTTMGYQEDDVLVNRSRLTYIRSDQAVVGLEYYINRWARLTVEGFYKKYTHSPLSLTDSIPLACKGTDYAVSGNEAAASTARGRAYGVEVMLRWLGLGRFTALASYTWYRSQFQNPATGRYLPSAWDYRHLFTLSGTCKLPRNWDIGMKVRLMGGAPYTPYDEYVSSLIPAWDATARPYYDYGRYNTGRLKTFYEVDLRVDKSFYFKGGMLGFYIDLQNVLNFKYDNQPLLISTGETYVDDNGTERYRMKYIAQQSGTILPTLGITVEF